MLNELFPPEINLQIDEHNIEDGKLHLYGRTTRTSAACPVCGTTSSRKNADYARHPADLPCMGKRVKLHLSVKRFFCDNEQCERITFSERFGQFVTYKARRTSRLKEQQLGVGLELGGEAGKRVLNLTQMPTSGPTIIDDIRKMPEKEVSCPRVLGLDDWAKRRGQTYGTLFVDLETREPIDLIDSREASVVEEWLKNKEGIEIVSRDRSREYKKAVTAALPEAEQVADRFHILKNLREATEKFIREKPKALQAAGHNKQIDENVADSNAEGEGGDATETPDPSSVSMVNSHNEASKADLADDPAPQPMTKAQRLQAATHARRQVRYELVRQKYQSGQSMNAIAKELRMAGRTVKRYIEADTCPQYPTGIVRRSKLDAFIHILESRWQAGCTNATKLWRELRDEHGFSGSRGLVTRWAIKQRALLPPETRYARQQSSKIAPKILREVKPAPWSARRVSWLLFHDKTKLDENELDALSRVLDADEHTATAYAYIQEFRQMLRNKCVDDLDDWLAKLTDSNLFGLTTFANGIKLDLAEVKNAFSMNWNNGVLEGHVNRLKFLKRQMFGRANFDLLRKRVLYRPASR